MIISLDTETTGVDFVHGAMPFLVTTCDDAGVVRFWEWDVDPLTRKPDVPPDDVAEIIELVDAADLVYLQNAKFDIRALATIGVALPWEKVRDTLVAGHLLASNHRHDLTWLCIEYLGKDIEHFELSVKEVVLACRAIAKRDYPHWKIANEGVEGMPSVKASGDRPEDKPWKNDMWLPRALVKELGKVNPFRLQDNTIPNNNWLTACSLYANADSEHTLPLGLEMERLIRDRNLWAIYQHKLEVQRVACEMECYGVTAIGEYTEATIRDYSEHVAECADALVCIASEYGHDLKLAEGAALNDNMREFFYGAVVDTCPMCGTEKHRKHWNGEGGLLFYRDGQYQEDLPKCPKCEKGTNRKPGVLVNMVRRRSENLGLPVIPNAKTGNASLDKDAVKEYLTTLDEGPALDFVKLLADKRKHGTDLTYMQSYCRFWVPEPGCSGYYRIHGSLNPCGSDHLRWASNSPNMHNVSVQEEQCEECDGEGCYFCGGTGKSRLSVRRCFGPAPGREWWDLDFRNLEKRIPVYECMEPSLVDVFERPDEPPYWGSDHNVLASLLFPEEYWPLAEVRDGFKKNHLLKYKRVKNTNFAKQYGAGKKKVDRTAGVTNAFEKIERGLPELAKLQASVLRHAERTGWVETLPDRTVDPARGYPILASRTEDGRVLSTTPFNYRTSGTACWVKNQGLVRCAGQCRRWRAEGFDAHIPLEVHDSILFDFPRGRDMYENLPRVLVLKALMERGGPDLVPAIPTPVSVDYVVGNWAEGVAVREKTPAAAQVAGVR